MALETSLEQPAPVRQIANAISQWVDRLGAVWVEGQVAQFNRRQGMNTVFMTLRDTVADISISVTCPAQVFDSLNPPMVEGASVVVHAQAVVLRQPRHAVALRPRDPDGRARRAAGPHRAAPPAARRRGPVRGRAQAPAAVPARARSAWSPRPTAPPSATCWRTPGAAGRRSASRSRYAAMQGTSSAAEVIEQLGRLDRDPEVDVIVIARGGGSVEDLLPFSDEGLVRAVFAAPHPGGLRDRPRAGQPAARPGRRRARLDPDRRRQAGRARRGRGGRSASSTCATAAASWSPPGWPASSTPWTPSAPAPRSPTPAAGSSARSVEVDALRDRARRTLHHQLDRAANDLGHQLARVRGMSPLATLQRGYAVLQDADGHVVTSVDAGRHRPRPAGPGGRRPRSPSPSRAPRPTELTAPSKETP